MFAQARIPKFKGGIWGFDEKRGGVEINILENFLSHFKNMYKQKTNKFMSYITLSPISLFFPVLLCLRRKGGGGENINPITFSLRPTNA